MILSNQWSKLSDGPMVGPMIGPMVEKHFSNQWLCLIFLLINNCISCACGFSLCIRFSGRVWNENICATDETVASIPQESCCRIYLVDLKLIFLLRLRKINYSQVISTQHCTITSHLTCWEFSIHWTVFFSANVGYKLQELTALISEQTVCYKHVRNEGDFGSNFDDTWTSILSSIFDFELS